VSERIITPSEAGSGSSRSKSVVKTIGMRLPNRASFLFVEYQPGHKMGRTAISGEHPVGFAA
jgi:hypothetical protein